MSGAVTVSRGREARRFGELTETTGTEVTPEGASMLYTRYCHAAETGTGKRVLEVGCGSGQGLGLLASRADRAVGADIDVALLREARAHYGSRMPLVCLSAEQLAFQDASFDVILFFEASYYVPRMDLAFDELVRVLAPSGTVIFVNANPERPNFIASPRSHAYHGAEQFRHELESRGFDTRVEGAFPTAEPGIHARVIAIARRALEGLGLVPTTLRGRALLKRLLYRNLRALPVEIGTNYAPREPLRSLASGSGFKVLYVTATRVAHD
jgi:SAM-dependent methyltransferase